MKWLFALCLGLLVSVAQAEITFDGSATPIPMAQWRILDLRQVPDITALAADLEAQPWRSLLDTSPARQVTHNAVLLRADFSSHYRGAQRLLLVIPYAVIPDTRVGVVRDGELLQWQPLRAQSDVEAGGWEAHRTFGMMPLTISEPGRYQLLILGSSVANAVMIHSAELHLEQDFTLQAYPQRVALAAFFLGTTTIFFLICLALLLYRYRPLFCYALIFLGGASGTLLLREGLLFLPFSLHVDWWMKHMLPLAMGLTYSGLILYIREDLSVRRWPRLRWLLGFCGLATLAAGLANLGFPLRDHLSVGLASLVTAIGGLLIALFLIVERAIHKRGRHILFALFFGSFIVITLVRFGVGLFSQIMKVPSEPIYVSVILIGIFVFVEYVWALTREYVQGQTRKTADVTRFDLVSRFSHELRTPLNAVIGLADLLKNARDLGQVKSYANMIHSAGGTLLNLVNDILDFSKLGSRQSSLAKQSFRLDKLVADVCIGFVPKVMETRVFLEPLLDPVTPVFLRGDESRLKQVFSNLVSNAIKFSGRGSRVTIRVAEGRRSGERVELVCSVTDKGRGIPADQLDSIFEPFAQVDEADSDQLGGTGLGLPICKLLVEQMGGSIHVDSEPGQGSTFRFNVWLQLDPQAPELEPYFSVLRHKRILFVCNLPHIVTQIADWLRHWDVELTVIESCRDWPDGHFDMVVAETLLACTERDLEALNSLPDTTALHILTMHSPEWLEQIRHPHVRRLIVPAPMLDYLASFAAQLGGPRAEFLGEPVADTLALVPRHRVLLVDDNSVNLMVASKLLESLGVECAVAAGGQQALDLLCDQHHFSLVLLDCEMPVVDGFEVCRRWRAYERFHQLAPLPVVALTAHALNEVRSECLAVGMDDVLYKPVGRDELMALLRRFPANLGRAVTPPPASGN